MHDVVIRPLKYKDLVEFYERSLGRHSEGWAVEYKGELAAVVGVTIYPTIVVAWSEIKPGIRAPKRTVLKAAKIMMDKIIGLGYPVLYAVANPELTTAPMLLARLGWDHIETSARGKVFKWEIR